MALARKLRLVVPESGPRTAPLSAVPDIPPAVMAVGLADRPAPHTVEIRRLRFRPALIASLILHAGVAAAILCWAEIGEERAAGGTDDLVVLQGASIELLDSLPSLLVEARVVESSEPAPEARDDAPVAEAVTPTVTRIADVAPMADAAPAATMDPADTPAAEPGSSAPVRDAVMATAADDAIAPPLDALASTASPDARPGRADEAAEAPDRPAQLVDAETIAKADPLVRKAEPVKPAPSRAAPASAAKKAASGPTKGVPGAGGSSRDNVGKASASSYRSRLVGHLRRYQTYPAAAASRRLTGTVVVTFTIGAGGGVTAARVARSSGEAILDSAAVGMVRHASPFPPIPAGLGASMTISAPIRFAR